MSWKPHGSKAKRLIGNIYVLKYRGIYNYVTKFGGKAMPINVADLTPNELRIIADFKDKYETGMVNKDWDV